MADAARHVDDAGGAAAPVRVPAYILAGGLSRRFGRDKARATLGGVPLVRRIAEGLAPAVGRVTVVADREAKYADLGLTTLADHQPGQGPLGGLARALTDLREQADGPWLLLASCDLVEAKPAWVAQLIAAARDDSRAVVFGGERWEPLFALYHQAAEPVVAEQLAAGRRAMHALLARLAPVVLPLPDDWPAVAQVNTPAELERAQAMRREPRDADGA